MKRHLRQRRKRKKPLGPEQSDNDKSRIIEAQEFGPESAPESEASAIELEEFI